MIYVYVFYLSSYIPMFREIYLSFVFCDYLRIKLISELRTNTHCLLIKNIFNFKRKQFNNSSTLIYSHFRGLVFWESEVVYLFLFRKLMTLLLKIVRGSINFIIFQKTFNHLLQLHHQNSNTTWH